MATDRYVLLGLARPRQPWFRQVARWATTASIPADFVMCLSLEEVTTRLGSARRFSALLVDSAVAGFDRDLIAAANAAACPVIVVDDGRNLRDWEALGAATVLRGGTNARSDAASADQPVTRGELMRVLDEVAQKVAKVDGSRQAPTAATPHPSATGRLVTVTGRRGQGSSITAMAIAQGLAARSDQLLLADLALDANQALLHDTGDVIPGVQELVEAFRLGAPSATELPGFTIDLPNRNYRLLMGLRRHRDWNNIRPRAFDAAIDALLANHHVVVADVEADVEGNSECGSLDIEQRNLFARHTTRAADLVVIVGHATFSGLHGLLRVIDDLVGHGVAPMRLLPVLNRAPRNPRARAELSASLADLTVGRAQLANPVFLPERRRLDEALHAGDPLPAQLVSPITAMVEASLTALPATGTPPDAERPNPPAIPAMPTASSNSVGRWNESMAS